MNTTGRVVVVVAGSSGGQGSKVKVRSRSGVRLTSTWPLSFEPWPLTLTPGWPRNYHNHPARCVHPTLLISQNESIWIPLNHNMVLWGLLRPQRPLSVDIFVIGWIHMLLIEPTCAFCTVGSYPTFRQAVSLWSVGVVSVSGVFKDPKACNRLKIADYVFVVRKSSRFWGL